jgi:acetyltransferase-like isoleucine patch superfamily enzyme
MKIRNIISEFRLYVCNHIIGHIPSHSIRLFYYRNFMGFKIGNGSTVFMNCKFDCAKGLTIGENSVINAKCRLDSRGILVIGNNVSVSEEVLFLTADHNEDLIGVHGRPKKIIVEDYVWIGTRAMVLPGILIEKGGVIAAGAVVTRDVKSLNVVAGTPAKIINTRPAIFNYTAEYKRMFQ